MHIALLPAPTLVDQSERKKHFNAICSCLNVESSHSVAWPSLVSKTGSCLRLPFFLGRVFRMFLILLLPQAKGSWLLMHSNGILRPVGKKVFQENICDPAAVQGEKFGLLVTQR